MFESRAFLVTGATGIAESVVRALVAAGSRVVVVSNDQSQLDLLQESIPDHADVLGVQADLSDEDSANRAFEQAKVITGELHGVVGIAGGSGRRFGDGDIADITLDAWDATLQANLTPAFLTLRNAARSITRPGAVVLVSSVLAQSPEDRYFRTHAYAAAKGAIDSLVRSVAAAYAENGLSINAVAPGLVRTPMAERAFQDETIKGFIRGKQPLAPDFVKPDQVAQVILSLLANPAVTGQVVTVDGGWSVMSR